MFDYPTIGAIASFIADTRYPGGLPSTDITAFPPAITEQLRPAAEAAGRQVATAAVVLTGMALRTAGAAGLTELFVHMRDGTELHSLAPYSR